jgi:hypothetical protein
MKKTFFTVIITALFCIAAIAQPGGLQIEGEKYLKMPMLSSQN